ncbi:hypothetical protein C7M84_018228 [Penaeus vannamei]|uniref:Uncharacterized protein n=1 Tax=Penaeus vannamei TaxID=6689 RepID=A0A3R7PYW3_PENVA|nr:hypothetical protein C7M84_018228 [Penaeus vannamei]
MCEWEAKSRSRTSSISMRGCSSLPLMNVGAQHRQALLNASTLTALTNPGRPRPVATTPGTNDLGRSFFDNSFPTTHGPQQYSRLSPLFPLRSCTTTKSATLSAAPASSAYPATSARALARHPATDQSRDFDELPLVRGTAQPASCRCHPGPGRRPHHKTGPCRPTTAARRHPQIKVVIAPRSAGTPTVSHRPIPAAEASRAREGSPPHDGYPGINPQDPSKLTAPLLGDVPGEHGLSSVKVTAGSEPTPRARPPSSCPSKSAGPLATTRLRNKPTPAPVAPTARLDFAPVVLQPSREDVPPISCRRIWPSSRITGTCTGQGRSGPGAMGRQPLRRPRQPGPTKACHPHFRDGSRRRQGLASRRPGRGPRSLAPRRTSRLLPPGLQQGRRRRRRATAAPPGGRGPPTALALHPPPLRPPPALDAELGRTTAKRMRGPPYSLSGSSARFRKPLNYNHAPPGPASSPPRNGINRALFRWHPSAGPLSPLPSSPSAHRRWTMVIRGAEAREKPRASPCPEKTMADLTGQAPTPSYSNIQLLNKIRPSLHPALTIWAVRRKGCHVHVWKRNAQSIQTAAPVPSRLGGDAPTTSSRPL